MKAPLSNDERRLVLDLVARARLRRARGENWHTSIERGETSIDKSLGVITFADLVEDRRIR